MSSLERKLKRKQDKEAKKLENKLAKKLNMFDSLPENCLTCNKGYDKINKEQATTWKVVVNPGVVRLYCPECWAQAENVLEKYMEEKDERL